MYKLKTTLFIGWTLVLAPAVVADDVRLRLTLVDGTEAEVQITDDLGPLNSWEGLTPDIFAPAKGTFTNANRVGTAKGCGAIDSCWFARDFDIDDVSVGDEGSGVVNFAISNGHIGDMTWHVLEVD